MGEAAGLLAAHPYPTPSMRETIRDAAESLSSALSANAAAHAAQGSESLMQQKAEAAARLRDLHASVDRAKCPASTVHPGSLATERACAGGVGAHVALAITHQIDKDVERHRFGSFPFSA